MTRRRRWIPIVIVLCLLGAAPAYVGLCWWRARLKVQSLLQVLPDPGMKVWLAEYHRPSCFGEPVDDNGWVPYDRICREIHSSEEVQDQIGGLLNSAYPTRFPPPADLTRLRDEHRAWIDGIFLGLRSRLLRRGPDNLGDATINDAHLFLIACAEAERQAGRDPEALRLLAAVLGLSADSKRGGTPGIIVEALDAERTAAVIWRVVLSNHALTPAHLESACNLLDRIEAARPTLFDAIRIMHEGRRALMVSWYVKNDDRQPPGWRHLWSPTIRACELADEVDRDTRAMLALEALPSWKREEAAAAMEKAREEDEGLRWVADLLAAQAEEFTQEAVGRAMRDLIRVATALAWYETEKGRMPERLADLVPRYLPREPICAASGKPFPYENGVLTTPPEIQSGFSREAGAVDWPIRRR